MKLLEKYTPNVKLLGAACAAVSLLVVLTIPAVNAQDDRAQILAQAATQYASGLNASDRAEQLRKFSRSEILFHQVIQQNADTGTPSTPSLWISYGNAALQAEDIGNAIFAFRRTLEIDPANRQAAQNLESARTLLPDWIRYQDQSSLSDTLFFWQSFLSRPAQSSLAALCFLFAAACIALGLWFSNTLIRNLSVLPLLGWIVFSIGIYAGQSAASHPQAIVIADETTLRTADSPTSAPRLSQSLPSGAELTRISSRENWIEVDVGGRSGWVQSSAVRMTGQ